MKKIIPIILLILFAVNINAESVTDINVPASVSESLSEKSLSWYCVHTTDHVQPRIDAQMKFIDQYDAFAIDSNHAEWNSDDKVIYLTFDAGYENGNVSKILDVLKEKNVKGAFFILEHLAKDNAELVQRMDKEGHYVCNHTATHKAITSLSEEAIKTELDTLYNECKSMGVECKKYFRPPEGRFSEKTLSTIQNLGYKTVFWSFAYADWDNNNQPNKETAIRKILESTHNGEVILLHPTSSTNAEILPELIDSWRDMGFRFGTLDELTK